jgi:hypothetical protein
MIVFLCVWVVLLSFENSISVRVKLKLFRATLFLVALYPPILFLRVVLSPERVSVRMTAGRPTTVGDLSPCDLDRRRE